MNNESIIKYLSRTASEEEIQELFDWVESSEKNKQEFADLKNAWTLSTIGIKSSDSKSVVEFDSILAKITTEHQVQSNYHKGIRYFFFGPAGKIAASILISVALTACLSYFVWHKYEPETLNVISVPSGQQSQLTLSDGTKIWLNARSRLTFPANFSKKTRLVKLEGEGYFEVAHDENKPFIVETQNIAVKVLGTTFNIASYGDDKEAIVTLVNGSVSLLNHSKAKELVKLKPGEMAIFNKESQKVGISKVDPDLYTSWHNGQFKFRKLSFEKISRRLGRNFNVVFYFENQQLKNTTYNGSFYKYESLENILKVMKLNTQFSYQLKKDSVIIK